MERPIPSIIQLIEELDEKMQRVILRKTGSLTEHAGAGGGLLGSQEKIKEYVDELIEEIESIKKKNKGGEKR